MCMRSDQRVYTISRRAIISISPPHQAISRIDRVQAKLPPPRGQAYKHVKLSTLTDLNALSVPRCVALLFNVAKKNS